MYTSGADKKLFASLLLILFYSAAFAHTAVIDTGKLTTTDSAILYLKLGFTHILPLGFDHILFVLSLFLLSPKLKPVLLQATAFTVAHTVTLGLSMYKIITPPASVVEPLIAVSILFVAAENIFSQKIKTTRLAVVFLFGLVHGMGFASALGELGLPQNHFFSSLLLFNLGVELGQVTVILAAWFLLAKWFYNKTYYRKYIIMPASAMIGITALYLLVTRIGFSNDEGILVDANFTNAAMKNYNDSSIRKNEMDIVFWKNRVHPDLPDYTNSMRYAAALAQRYHLTGNMDDIRKSDSILLSVSSAFRNTEAGPYLSLGNHAILQHAFSRADSLLGIAKNIGLKKYDAAAAGFDISFELGYMANAASQLCRMQLPNDYGYQFRCSKLMHYKSEPDSSVLAMKAAYALAGADARLQQAALSNLGDLYMHTGDLKNAAACYRQCIIKDKSDMHSFMGLAWIALLHDKNDLLAEKILNFAGTKTASPEPLYKLVAVAQQRGNKKQEWLFANSFKEAVHDPRYGNMYNKYLISLYTGILQNSGKAVEIAITELKNRNTPQTQAWYAWTLFRNGQQQQALEVFEQKVSGKPLEALELYWMGKLLEANGKKGTAGQYFYEAAKNKYDLNPAIIADLKKSAAL